MKCRILILMSAYNGEKYIREQIDSVLAQETEEGDIEVTLRIRDDGSSDDTPRILEEYRRASPDKIELLYGENLGYNASFFTLLDSAGGYDYYALCDQDDKWERDKISRALREMGAYEAKAPSLPLLYACPSVLTDENLKPRGLTRLRKRPLVPRNTLIQNICPGHNQVMNGALLKLVQRPRDVGRIYVYDLWIANLASLYGKIIFDPVPGTLYRQHGGNELGSRGSAIGKLLKAGRRSLAGEGRKNLQQMAYFAEQNRKALEKEGLYAAVEEMLKADTPGKRLRFALRCPFYRQSRLETAAFRLAFLLGKY